MLLVDDVLLVLLVLVVLLVVVAFGSGVLLVELVVLLVVLLVELVLEVVDDVLRGQVPQPHSQSMSGAYKSSQEKPSISQPSQVLPRQSAGHVTVLLVVVDDVLLVVVAFG
jgi:hypothetical protein